MAEENCSFVWEVATVVLPVRIDWCTSADDSPTSTSNCEYRGQRRLWPKDIFVGDFWSPTQPPTNPKYSGPIHPEGANPRGDISSRCEVQKENGQNENIGYVVDVPWNWCSCISVRYSYLLMCAKKTCRWFVREVLLAAIATWSVPIPSTKW